MNFPRDDNRDKYAFSRPEDQSFSFLGERHPLPSSIIRLPKDDEEFNKLKTALDECTTASTATGTKRTVVAALVSIPISMAMKSFIPLFAFSMGAIGYDLYSGYRDCKRQRDALDLYLLKRHKIKLNNEREILEMKKEILMRTTGGDNSQQQQS